MTLPTKVASLTILLAFVVCSWSCRRETGFGKIKVEGTVIDFITKEPIVNQKVSMYAKRWYQGREGDDTFLGQTFTDGNGHFELKTKTARTDIYRLYYGAGGSVSGDTSFKTNKIRINIGTVFSGSSSVVFKVHLKPVSTNCLWTYDNDHSLLQINAGTETNLYYKRTFKYLDAKLHRAIFAFVYRIDQCSSANTTMTNAYDFPFQITDTLKTDVTY